MPTISHRPHRWSLSLVVIASSMLAVASASAQEMSGAGGCAVCGMTRCNSVFPCESVHVPVVDGEQDAKPLQILEHTAPHVDAGPGLAGRFGQSRTLAVPNLGAAHIATKLAHGHVRPSRGCVTVRSSAPASCRQAISLLCPAVPMMTRRRGATIPRTTTIRKTTKTVPTILSRRCWPASIRRSPTSSPPKRTHVVVDCPLLSSLPDIAASTLLITRMPPR